MDKVELPLLKGKEREKCIPLAVIVGVAILIFVLYITKKKPKYFQFHFL